VFDLPENKRPNLKPIQNYRQNYSFVYFEVDCGLVFRVPGYRSKGPGSISGATRFTEKYVWNGVYLAL
jgi:hypothetical protein